MQVHLSHNICLIFHQAANESLHKLKVASASIVCQSSVDNNDIYVVFMYVCSDLKQTVKPKTKSHVKLLCFTVHCG